jgi:alpha-beta hydrolase superfamily lysophospholipase
MEILSFREQNFFLTSSGNYRFGVTSIMPVNTRPKAIVQLITGMAEHAGRYREFAGFLAENGIGVFCADHPGQGSTAGKESKFGVIAKTRGWEIMLENIRALYTHIRKTHPEIPVYIFGHSMGSVLARHFTAVYPVYIQGLILSGPFETPSSILKLSRLIIKVLILFSGAKTKSRWFNKVFYGQLNRHFKPRPTMFEWISSVREEVDAYDADPGCGFFCSNAFYNNLFKGISAMKKSQHNLKYRKTLPMLILSGQDDPVGNFGKDAVKIHGEFYRQRFQNLTLKVVPHGRHELLREAGKERTYLYLLDWMNEHLVTR